MFYGVEEEFAVGCAILVADCRVMTDIQKLRIQKKMRKLMNSDKELA